MLSNAVSCGVGLEPFGTGIAGITENGDVRNRLKSTAGYTLIELATVLVALSIMSLMSYVKLRPALEHGKVNAAASVMAIDLQYAQLMAAKGRKPVVVILTVSTQQYVIRDRATSTLIYRTRYLGSGTDFSLTSMAGTATTLEVFPTGVTRTTTTFTLGRLKREAGRPQDVADVAELRLLHGEHDG
ncbi:MAG: prepilin-type N-terminal cleavage/methylation domain-containing protein [Gemmatimonadetes bacterium]|nr:prepilin-type N-terminal cleavage/methylation domain-containing protein [Gemmatimonadota bacterium]